MNQIKKMLALALVAALATTAFVGCDKTNTAVSSDTPSSTGSSTSTTVDNSSSESVDLEEKITLTIYQQNNTSGEFTSMGEQKCFIEFAERNNVDLKWEHPADGANATEQINLMIASGQLPDIINWNWRSMPGGIGKYVSDGVAIPLNPYLEQYAPNFTKAMADYPELAKVIPLDDGTIAAFSQMDPDPRRTTYSGIMIRQDWLDTLSLPTPVTVEDWHSTLTAFKNNDPNGNGQADEIPWTEDKEQMLNAFMPSYGILRGIYMNQDTQKIDYGPYNKDAYLKFLTTMKQWYDEGLIDPEFATNDNKMLTSKIVGGQSGATLGYVGGGIGNYTKAAREENPKFSIIGITPPLAENGISYMVQNDSKMQANPAIIVTTSCKSPERAISLVDYAYSEEGRTLLNYGIEGESFEIVGGKKVFVDSIMNPTAGKSRVQSVVPYAQPIYGWAKVMDFEAQAQIQYEIEEQTISIENWLKSDNALQIHPNIILSPEESDEYAAIYNDVKTYVDEMSLKFILGSEDLASYDSFHENLKNMQVDRMIEIYQAAYERFIQR